MQNTIKKQGLGSAKTIAKVGILSAIAYVLMFISVPLPIFPSFLKIDYLIYQPYLAECH